VLQHRLLYRQVEGSIPSALTIYCEISNIQEINIRNHLWWFWMPAFVSITYAESGQLTKCLKAMAASFKGILETAGRPQALADIKAVGEAIIDGPDEGAVLRMGLAFTLGDGDCAEQIIGVLGQFLQGDEKW
jgi:hypothetical protein